MQKITATITERQTVTTTRTVKLDILPESFTVIIPDEHEKSTTDPATIIVLVKQG